MIESEATWELVHLMNQEFPSFHLEDKVQFEKGVLLDLQFDTLIRGGVEKGYHKKRNQEGRKHEYPVRG